MRNNLQHDLDAAGNCSFCSQSSPIEECPALRERVEFATKFGTDMRDHQQFLNLKLADVRCELDSIQLMLQQTEIVIAENNQKLRELGFHDVGHARGVIKQEIFIPK